LDKLRHIPNEDDQWEDDDTFTYDDVVDGSVPITISHGGGEMADLERGLWEDIHGKKAHRKRKCFWLDENQL
jgi:accessory colonization factor AcfC